MNRSIVVIIFVFFTAFNFLILPCISLDSKGYQKRGYSYYKNGNFEDAALCFKFAADGFKKRGKNKLYCKALLELSRAYQFLGEYNKASLVLILSEKIAIKYNYKNTHAMIMSGLGNASIFLGKFEKAEKDLKKAVKIGIECDNLDAVAAALNNLGNLYVYTAQYEKAVDSYRAGVKYSSKTGQKLMSAKMLANIGRTAFLLKKLDVAIEVLDIADQRFRSLPDSHGKVYGLINIAQSYKRLATLSDDTTQVADLLYLSYKLLTDSAIMAEKIMDMRAASYAYGYLAQLHEDRGSFDDAIELTRKALQAAQKGQAPESVYLWEAQSGKYLKKEKKYDDAIVAYRNSIETLQTVRQAMSSGGTAGRLSYRDAVEPVYYGLADLYLLRSVGLKGKEEKKYLLKARETIESMKTAEMQDYFHDDCAVALKAKKKSLDSIVSDAAIIYVIPFQDRLELLVSTSKDIKRFEVKVTSKRLMKNAKRFRKYVVDATSYKYLKYSYRLYNWIIKPIEKELKSQNITTLVFVPDGALRSIPMSALRDRKAKKYLIEKYAIAITPGLNLTDPKPIKRTDIKVMMAGLSKSVQGFAALGNVEKELSEINLSYDCDVLKNQEFLVETFGKSLKAQPYSIVHIASHGEFLDDARKSYLLAWDKKMTMNHLERFMSQTVFRDKPVELLTLSACKTAAGNDKASLGLAGVAIKAGARSALASLWYVDDKASSNMIVEFYKNLKNSSISKAKALELAQVKLLKEDRYKHPLYWSAFILIGNWL